MSEKAPDDDVDVDRDVEAADALGDAVAGQAGVPGVAGGGAAVSGVVLGGGERNEARADAREAPADGRV